MKNSKGFTLVELLIVLLIVSIVSLLVLPSMYKTITRQQSKHFFELFNSDVLYVQNKSLNSVENSRILPLKQNYIVLDYDEESVERLYPHDLNLLNYNAPRIRFSTTGSVYNPDTYIFSDKHRMYKVVFPFGKGRHYIEEL